VKVLAEELQTWAWVGLLLEEGSPHYLPCTDWRWITSSNITWPLPSFTLSRSAETSIDLIFCISIVTPPTETESLGGRVADVGLGGFALGGGFSALSPMYGLAMDNIFVCNTWPLPSFTLSRSAETSIDLIFCISIVTPPTEVKGGGHARGPDDSVSVGGVTIDMQKMRSIDVSADRTWEIVRRTLLQEQTHPGPRLQLFPPT
jgi:hypothetical protein